MDRRLPAFVLALTLLPTPPLHAQQGADTLSLAERQYGLAVVWSGIRTDYVNFDRLTFDWDSAYIAAMKKVAETSDRFAFYQELARLVARVGDGHTKISIPRDVRATQLRNFPLRTRLIDGRVIVTEVRNDSLFAAGIRPGMEVVSIDGIPTLDYGRESVQPFQASSTPQDALLRTYDYELFRGPADRPLSLVLSHPDTGELHVRASRMLPWNRGERRPLVDFNVLEPGIGHLRLRGFDSRAFYAAFDSVYAAILETDALIIDIRDNGGGTSTYGYYVIGHLVDEPFHGTRWYSRHRVSKMAAGLPSADYYLHRRRSYDPADVPKYEGRLALLINEATFSAAEDFAATFDALGLGPVIGSASGGSSGEPIRFELPGGGTLRVCTERNTYPDGREFVGTGILPDIPARPSARGIRDGVDEVLAVAVEHLRRDP